NRRKAWHHQGTCPPAQRPAHEKTPQPGGRTPGRDAIIVPPPPSERGVGGRVIANYATKARSRRSQTSGVTANRPRFQCEAFFMNGPVFFHSVAPDSTVNCGHDQCDTYPTPSNLG